VPCKKAEIKYGIQIDEALLDCETDGLFVQNNTDNTVSIKKRMRLGVVIPVEVEDEVMPEATLTIDVEEDQNYLGFDYTPFDINPLAGARDK
jgi:hypothetical protein